MGIPVPISVPIPAVLALYLLFARAGTECPYRMLAVCEASSEGTVHVCHCFSGWCLLTRLCLEGNAFVLIYFIAGFALLHY